MASCVGLISAMARTVPNCGSTSPSSTRPSPPTPMNPMRTGPPLTGPLTAAATPSPASAGTPATAFRKFRRPTVCCSGVRFTAILHSRASTASHHDRSASARRPSTASQAPASPARASPDERRNSGEPVRRPPTKNAVASASARAASVVTTDALTIPEHGHPVRGSITCAYLAPSSSTYCSPAPDRAERHVSKAQPRQPPRASCRRHVHPPAGTHSDNRRHGASAGRYQRIADALLPKAGRDRLHGVSLADRPEVHGHAWPIELHRPRRAVEHDPLSPHQRSRRRPEPPPSARGLPTQKSPTGTERRRGHVEGTVRGGGQLVAKNKELEQLIADANGPARTQLVHVRELAGGAKDRQRISPDGQPLPAHWQPRQRLTRVRPAA